MKALTTLGVDRALGALAAPCKGSQARAVKARQCLSVHDGTINKQEGGPTRPTYHTILKASGKPERELTTRATQGETARCKTCEDSRGTDNRVRSFLLFWVRAQEGRKERA